MGLLINLCIVPGGIFLFLMLIADRLDGNNKLSMFLLLLPFWIALIPIFAYVIIHGLAAKNKRINICERVFLSIIVPIGFLATVIMLVYNYEKWGNRAGYPTHESLKWLKLIFIPHVLSLLCLYLYLRCLVRKEKVYDINDIE